MSQGADLTGKTCVVTGANKGIGLETAIGLTRLGARVLLACRDESRGTAALAKVRAAGGGGARDGGARDGGARNGSAELVLGDLAALASVRDLAARLKGELGGGDVLVNNAAILGKRRSVTVDGHEAQLAVNHLAPFLLTNLLLDGWPADQPLRIVTVSSAAHAWAKPDLDDLEYESGRYSGQQAYCRTKLFNLLFTKELARRRAGTKVTANTLHPGMISTDLLDGFWPGPKSIQRLWSRLLGKSTERGARTSIHVASSPDLDGVSGEYFVDARRKTPSNDALDPELATRLWERSCEMTGVDN